MSYFYEKSTSRVAKRFARFPYYGTEKVLNLLEYQDDEQKVLISDQHLKHYFSTQENEWTTTEKIALYCSLFKGRQDVYAKSYINQEGKIQYFPSYDYGWKNLPPEKRTCQPLTEQVLKGHFRGETSIGLFPILVSDTCFFLAIDFDDKDWKEAVLIMRRVAEKHHLEAHIEISRSGNGAHVWFFFAEETSCQQARNMGKKLLELAMQESKMLRFSSFDRMFPNQDRLPKGGFGNLIALPLQGEAVANGRTVFVDEGFEPYCDQWGYLKGIKKIARQQLETFLGSQLVEQYDDKRLKVSLSNVLTIRKADISAKTTLFLRKLASFSNPEFYLKQATSQPTYQTPERIYLFDENDDELFLPRGLLLRLKESFEEVVLEDKTYHHEKIRVSFQGALRFEQELALSDLLASTNGLLCAETGFGKTVLGAALIAKRQARTIILVHNRQLLEQWMERLANFLLIKEEEAVRYTATGREKVIGHIGQYAGTKKWRTKLIDVVMIQSLFQLENVGSFLTEYDMMLVDECHHVTALQFEKVVAQFAGPYLYGLTATPERKNGHEPIVYQRIGDILHTAQSHQVSFRKELSLRLTSFGKMEVEKVKSSSFTNLSEWLSKDHFRNQQICQDIIQMVEEKRKIVVLVNRIEHLTLLQKSLAEKATANVYCLSGKSKRKEAQEILTEIDNIDDGSPFVLLSTGKYIGEGFDLPKLDTLILAAPLSWKNNLIQYAGRLHRPYQGKEEVRIIDYLDIHVPYLEKMYQKRQVAYQKMNYHVNEGQEQQSFYSLSDYGPVFQKDLQNVQSTIYLRLHSFTQKKIYELVGNLQGKQIVLEVSESNKLSHWLKGMESALLTIHLNPNKIDTNIVILDESLIWYGNISPLGYAVDDGSLLRLESQVLAKELLMTNLERKSYSVSSQRYGSSI